MYCVYWIRHKDHTDMFSQGYVGVTSNFNRRMRDHLRCASGILKKAIKKHGWDNLIKSEIVIGDSDYCLYVERALRSSERIGWNLISGGGLPPSRKGKPHSEHQKSSWSKHRSGENCGSFRGVIFATNTSTGETIELRGNKQMKSLGFQYQNISHCLRGLRKTHKGHTFTRKELV